MNNAIRKNIRHQMRLQRNQLTAIQQFVAARRLSQQLFHLIKKNKYKFKSDTILIATYKAGDGEISTSYFEKKIKNLGIKIDFLYPVIQPDKTLKFGRKTRGRYPRLNMYEIPEPLKLNGLDINRIDILLLPLVAATIKGERLGMGGGFYDRTLARIRKPGPLLVGVAHQLQILPEIPIEPWDRPIHYIATDRQIIKC